MWVYRVVLKLQSGTGYQEQSVILGGIQAEARAPSETLSTVWDTRRRTKFRNQAIISYRILCHVENHK